MKNKSKATSKNQFFELRQHIKTPPSLHALIEMASHINSALDDKNTITLTFSEVNEMARKGLLSYLLQDRLSRRIDFRNYFRDEDTRLSWYCVFSEALESLKFAHRKRVSILKTGLGLVQDILLETMMLYYVMPPQAALLAWPGNVN
jgi:hypothetical protein